VGRVEEAVVIEALLVAGLGVGVALVGASFAVRRRRPPDVTRRLRALHAAGAGRLQAGLEQVLVVDSRLGPIEHRYLVQGADPPVETTRLELRLPRLLPALRLRPQLGGLGDPAATRPDEIVLGDIGFDRRFLIRGPDPEAVRTVLDDEARRTLYALIKGHWRSLSLQLEPDDVLGGTALRMDLQRWLLSAESLAAVHRHLLLSVEAMIRAWDAPWLQVAERLGLRPVLSEEPGRLAFAGELEGRPLRLEQRGAGARAHALLAVELALPLELEAAHRDVAQEEGWLPLRETQGNPVLDATLAVRSGHPERCRLLLADDALTGALLPVLHGHPGSRLEHRRLQVRVAGGYGEGLGEAVDDFLLLVQALDAALARLEGEA
jgi:hypothetical protein